MRHWPQLSIILIILIKLSKMILKNQMRLHKLLIELSQMGSIFIEIFDVKVLNAIYPDSRQYGITYTFF